MSYNMIDSTLFEKLDCSAESHYHKTFASRQKYEIFDITIHGDFSIKLSLSHEEGEANNEKYAEVVVKKMVEISYNNLYGSDPMDKLIKAFDVAVGAYYIIESTNDSIFLTAKEKGRVPNLITPKIEVVSNMGVTFKFVQLLAGNDTSIFVPLNKRNVIHFPITTMGNNYVAPVPGDRLIFVDSTQSNRDKTFTREVVKVEKHANCTCDVVHLDEDIDRLEANHSRIDGIGLKRPSQNINNYTAKFDKVKVFKRRTDFKKILDERALPTGKCIIPIGNLFDMKAASQFIAQDFIAKSENPHLGKKMNYFGAIIPWQDYANLLEPIYAKFGHILCDHLFLLTSNKSRPEYLVHIDYDEIEKDKPVVASFTWPVLNCTSETTTVWYEATLNGNRITTYGQQDVVISDPKIELTEIDRYCFDSETFNAVILKHDEWHTLYNNSDDVSNRMLLQWRFKPDVKWEQIQEMFRTV